MFNDTKRVETDAVLINSCYGQMYFENDFDIDDLTEDQILSNFSVLNYARENKMILITAYVENKRSCDENDVNCIAIGKDSVLDFAVNKLKRLQDRDS